MGGYKPFVPKEVIRLKHGKRYNESLKLVDSTKMYDTDEAFKVVVDTAKAKFDESIEAHIKLGVDSS